jgi:hypothetical protein
MQKILPQNRGKTVREEETSEKKLVSHSGRKHQGRKW